MDEVIKEEFYNRLFMYPSDYHYLKEIAKSINLEEKDLWRLYSLMGAQELANTLALASYKHFRYDENSKQDFRFNLHTHTNFSDGSVSLESLLEKMTERVDFCAVTDHDHGGLWKDTLYTDKWNREFFIKLLRITNKVQVK